MAYLGNAIGVESQRLVTTFTATASQTDFDPSGGYTLGYVDVYLNGVKLVDGTDYTADDGVTVTLSVGASSGDVVELVTYTPRGLSDGYTKSEADTRYARLNEDATFGALTSNGIDDNATSTAITIDSNENVGIGTSSPTNLLTIGTGTFTAAGASTSAMYTDASIGLTQLADGFTWNTRGGSERARIDSSGSLLVGTTTAYGSDGTTIGLGEVVSKKTSFRSLTLDRLSTDGDIAQFRKDGSSVGSIGTGSGNFHIESDRELLLQSDRARLTQVYLGDGNDSSRSYMFPIQSNVDLGRTTNPWRDLYLSGGVYLGGTGSDNKLDDYEEGTFTVTDQSGASLSITANTSNYTKVGRLVYANYIVTYPSTSDTNSARLSLPIPSIDSSSETGGAVLETNYGDTIMASVDSTTYVRFRAKGVTPLTNANLSGRNLRFSILYLAS